MFTAPIVLSETLVSPREKELGCVLIDFGAETTTVVVYADNFIRHMAVIPFGGKTITQDIRDLKVTLVDAENLKKTFGYALASLDKQPKAIKLESPLQGQDDILVKTKVMNAIIEARLDEILDMVFMQVEKSGFMDRLSAGIIITGGASQLRGLSELIEMKTGLKTRQGNFEQLLVNPEDAKQLTQAHSLLLGLVNFGTEDCQLIEKTIEIQPVETPPMPQKDKSKKKGNRLKDFVNKLEGSLFNERDFEDN
jgi:cell division protein FtsA